MPDPGAGLTRADVEELEGLAVWRDGKGVTGLRDAERLRRASVTPAASAVVMSVCSCIA